MRWKSRSETNLTLKAILFDSQLDLKVQFDSVVGQGLLLFTTVLTLEIRKFSESCVFFFSLLAFSLSAGGENQGQKVAAATYLKNFTKHSINNNDGTSLSKVSKEFKDQLMQTLLLVEPAVLKVLVEVVCELFDILSYKLFLSITTPL